MKPSTEYRQHFQNFNGTHLRENIIKDNLIKQRLRFSYFISSCD